MFTFPFTMMSSADDAYTPAAALYLDGSADYLSWTPSGAAASDTDKTISFWVKRTKFGSVQWILDVSSNGDQIQYTVGDKLEVSLNATIDTHYTTTAVYRDPTAWTNVVVAFDTNNGTAANRKRLWINGVLQEDADLDNHDDPSDGDNVDWMKQSVAHNIGRRGNNSQFFEGYLADFIGIDGALDADSFGELSDGIWVPKDPSTISMPSNSFWLAFDDPTHANGVGKDSSGNNNHFTPSSMGANNIAVDGPANSTDKEITIYPSYDADNSAIGSSVSFASNNLAFTNGTGGSWRIAPTNLFLSSGKYYFEVVISSISSANIGVATSQIGSLTADLGTNAYGWGYENGGNKKNGNSSTSYGNSYSNGNVVQVAIDLDNKAIYFGEDNTWQNSGDPTSGSSKTNAAFTNSDNSFGDAPVMPVVALHTAGTATIRFDSSSWSHSAPTGYSAITKTVTGIGNSAVQHEPRSNAALSEGNLKTTQTSSGSGNWGRSKSTIALPASGKIYLEATVNEVGNAMAFGLISSNEAWGDGDGGFNGANAVNMTTYNSGWNNSYIYNESTQLVNRSAVLFATGDIIQLAVDTSTKKVWFGRNNVWYNSSAGTDGNPSAGSNQVATYTTTARMFPAVWMYYGSPYGQPFVTMNYGATPFVYDPPTDFVPLSTQNITSGYTGSLSDAIVTANATEANIKSTTEGAHSFSNWISFLYNRDASEQRIFYASDDSSNYIPFADDGVLGKNSFPTLAGSNNWTGCAIATGASTGIATGTISHSNGSDTSAAHGLTSPTGRFSILISSEATSSHDGWFWFHPDMTANNNIRLAQGGSEGQQSSKYYAAVTSSNAVVKSAAPTGTYRYIVFAENDLVSFYSYTNIAGTDSAYVHTNNKPEWMLWGQMTETGGGYGQYLAWSGTHNAYNPWTKCTRIHNISTNEITGSADILGAGFKVTEASPGQGAWHQTDGQTTCGISIGTPFALNNRAR